MFKPLLAIALLAASMSAAQEGKADKKDEKASFLLPEVFSGWQRTQTKLLPPDKKNLVLQELRAEASQTATYSRDDRKLTVKATRFADATGAFGAFTAERTPDMAPEKICSQAASSEKRVLFQCANVLVDVTLDKSTGMTASDMRSLAAQIPAIGGGAAQLPTLNRYFPVELQNNGHFAVGPEGAKKAGSPVPTELIDFSASPELSVSTFLGDGGDAKMMLLNYPTPALARAQEEKLIEWAKQQKFTPPNTLPAEGEALNTFQTRRVGPIVAVITGAINASEAKLMLEKLHYDAEITLHEPSGLEAKNNIGSLVYAAVLLAFMIIAIALIMGLAFGGFRVMAKRWYPGRFVDRPQDVEFIKLDIGGDGK